MEGHPKTRRRWFRFSLRTMLVLVTLVCVLCGYLGWAMNWKRQRRAFIARAEGFASIYYLTPTKFYYSVFNTAPTALWLIGEGGYRTISVKASEVEEAKRLFPESHIYVLVLDGQR